MNNNHGWGLSTMLILCAIIGFALIVSAIIYDRAFDENLLPNSNIKKDPEQVESHDVLENNVIEAAQKYVDKYYQNMPAGSKVYVSVKQLQVEKFLNELVDEKNIICSGYASFESINSGVEYKAYIKCGNEYVSKGYESSFDK